LDASSFVKLAEYKSKEVAAEEMKKELGEDFVAFLGDNPLEPSINVRLNSEYVNNDSLAWIKTEIQAMGGGKTVKEINYHQILFEELDKNERSITLGLLIFASLLTVVAVGLIFNTIQLSIYSKRFLLRTMYLVGATQSFIRKPFIIRGIRQGVVAGIIACLLIIGCFFLADKFLPDLIVSQNPNQLLFLLLGVVALGMIISSFSSAFAVSRYLRLKQDDLYF
jgi:cell division transport system permease protein